MLGNALIRRMLRKSQLMCDQVEVAQLFIRDAGPHGAASRLTSRLRSDVWLLTLLPSNPLGVGGTAPSLDICEPVLVELDSHRTFAAVVES